MSKDYEAMTRRYKIESDEKWREICDKMPYIRFPAEWEVQVIPPFAGAMARFVVKLPNGETRSVYADFYSNLGYYGGFNQHTPYWEVYPYEGDTGRCDIGDVAELLRMIGAPDHSSAERSET